jgi:hypothetical protein
MSRCMSPGVGRTQNRMASVEGMTLLNQFEPEIVVNPNWSSGGIGLARRVRAARRGRHCFTRSDNVRAVSYGAPSFAEHLLSHSRLVPASRHCLLKLFSFEVDYLYPCRSRLPVDLGFGVERIRMSADYQGID